MNKFRMIIDVDAGTIEEAIDNLKVSSMRQIISINPQVE